MNVIEIDGLVKKYQVSRSVPLTLKFPRGQLWVSWVRTVLVNPQRCV